MHTQITCPNCRTPFTAELHQVIDAGKNPELKHLLLSGQLNLAICPACGAGGQMATAMLFHDPEHEMFLVHVPQELNLSHIEREKLIGRLTQQAMDDLPAEQRRAYMLQPQMMLSMQSLMEKVLETEGITPEMVARQRRQSELLQTLANADKDVAEVLIKERMDEIDETFFAMLQAYIDAAAQQTRDNKQLLSLTNLRARLMVETPVGRRLEQKQLAVHALSRESKQKNGLTPELLLQHILANREDEGIVDALVAAGRGALTYTFFSLLSNEIEKETQAGRQPQAQQLIALRERLLKIFDSMQEESKRVMSKASATLSELLTAPDKEAAVRTNLREIDDAFMYLLMTRMAEAEKNGDKSAQQDLAEIHELILKQVESQYPPEIVLLNKLMATESSDELQTLLNENQHLLSADLLKLLDAVSQEASSTGRPELDGRLQDIRTMVETHLQA